jgi:hypothetical protein
MEAIMKRLKNIELFLQELNDDRSIVFNFEKISSVERELFLSIQGVINEKYNYHLDGMTTIHRRRLIEHINKRNLIIGASMEKLIKLGFDLYVMFSERNLKLGYDDTQPNKDIRNEDFKKFVKYIQDYISVFKCVQS